MAHLNAYLCCDKLNNIMHNQSIETYHHNKSHLNKYSLRHRFAALKVPRQPSCIKTIPVFQTSTHPQTKYQPELPVHVPTSKCSHWEQGEFDNKEFSCFTSAKKAMQVNKVTQVAFHSSYLTPSTSYSTQNQGSKTLKAEKSCFRQEAQSKYSLKNSKKEGVHKSSSLYAHNNGFSHQSEEHLMSDNISMQSNTDQHITQERHSEVGNTNKYSLKNKGKKTAKPDVLVSLKYTDLNQSMFSPNNFTSLNNQSKSYLSSTLFCQAPKQNYDGCKCEPKCFWTSRWLGVIGQLYWQKQNGRKDEGTWEAAVRQIERDLPRTQPGHPAFQSERMLGILKDVLIGYAQIDQQVSYVQGMNFVAAAIVYHSNNSIEALHILTYLMKVCGFRKLFLGDLSLGRLFARRLCQDLRRRVFDLYDHLRKEGIDLELFASSWYFSLCGSFVPLQAMHLFIDKLIRRGFAGINELILTLILRMHERLMGLSETNLMQVFSNQKLCQYGEGVDWIDISERSERLLLPLIQL